jgi:hypothetical protein
MATKLDIPCVPQFVIGGELTNVAQRREDWMKRFKYYMEASGITAQKQKRALLLHLAGPEVQDIYDTLEHTGENFENIINDLNTYFARGKMLHLKDTCFGKQYKTKTEL